MATGLELYEALKPHVGEDAARMIAEALPLSDRVATKADLDHLGATLRSEFRAGLKELEAGIYRRMLTFNATLFLGLAGMIVAILVKG
jgi:hypothetical protein